MGWTGTTNPLAGVEIKFPTLEAAIRYAHRQGLDFTVEGMPLDGPALLHQSHAPAVLDKQAA